MLGGLAECASPRDFPEMESAVESMSETTEKPPAPARLGWGGARANSGGARANSGGPRANSGGPRPNCGGPQPGAGRPRKPEPIPVASFDPHLPRWSVVAFHGQAEISATGELARQGYEVYLALIAIRRRDPVITSLWRVARVPLLPGYGFIRIARTDPRLPITETRGVREVLLRPDGHPAVIADSYIDKLRAADAERLELPPDRGPVLPVGAAVIITEGPFVEHSATVVECDGIRTQVRVTLFGREVPMWLARTALEPTA